MVIYTYFHLEWPNKTTKQMFCDETLIDLIKERNYFLVDPALYEQYW